MTEELEFQVLNLWDVTFESQDGTTQRQVRIEADTLETAVALGQEYLAQNEAAGSVWLAINVAAQPPFIAVVGSI